MTQSLATACQEWVSTAARRSNNFGYTDFRYPTNPEFRFVKTDLVKEISRCLRASEVKESNNLKIKKPFQAVDGCHGGPWYNALANDHQTALSMEISGNRRCSIRLYVLFVKARALNFFDRVFLFSAAIQFIPAQSSVKKAEILQLLDRKPLKKIWMANDMLSPGNTSNGSLHSSTDK